MVVRIRPKSRYPPPFPCFRGAGCACTTTPGSIAAVCSLLSAVALSRSGAPALRGGPSFGRDAGDYCRGSLLLPMSVHLLGMSISRLMHCAEAKLHTSRRPLTPRTCSTQKATNCDRAAAVWMSEVSLVMHTSPALKAEVHPRWRLRALLPPAPSLRNVCTVRGLARQVSRQLVCPAQPPPPFWGGAPHQTDGSISSYGTDISHQY
eukprot:scaffold4840_cov115-Isochrysis_galbana.AAC.5